MADTWPPALAAYNPPSQPQPDPSDDPNNTLLYRAWKKYSDRTGKFAREGIENIWRGFDADAAGEGYDPLAGAYNKGLGVLQVGFSPVDALIPTQEEIYASSLPEFWKPGVAAAALAAGFVLPGPSEFKALDEAADVAGGARRVAGAVPGAPHPSAVPVPDVPLPASALPSAELLAKMSAGHPGRISQRVPTSPKSTEDFLGGKLHVDTESLRKSPELFNSVVDLVRDYPGIGRIAREKTDDTLRRFMQFGKDNLLYLHDQMPPQIRERAKLWYDGARAITDRWSKKYGVPDIGIAGSIAALSPQKDWFQNVSLAERVNDIMHEHRGFRWDDQMEETARRIYKKPDLAEVHDAIRGKSLDEILRRGGDEATYLASAWVRAFDEAKHDRRHSIISPEGNFLDYAKNVDGSNSAAAWRSLADLQKAVSSLEDPSLANVAHRMGFAHKVRNFYNNILDPNSPFGDYTSDTHNVAATLFRPLAGNDFEVAHSFGNSYTEKGARREWLKQVYGPRAKVPNAGGTNLTGIQGLYPVYADIGRAAANDRNLLPRELQSITWEGVRGLFPDTFKSAKAKETIDRIWQDVGKGFLSPQEARNEIVKFAGGIKPPDWAVEGRVGQLPQGARHSSYR
jgi:hypothetical protein